jgi:malonyl-CoA O-methyltransferase
MITSYEEFRRDGRLPATYEVIYGQAWAPQPDAVRRRHASDEVRVPVSRIGRR